MSTLCPQCDAPQIVDHPMGILAFSHDPTCSIGNSEDGTRCNDHEQVTGATVYGALPHPTFVRATTQAENELLVELGYLPSLLTTVTRITAGGAVVHRSFELVPTP